jgi:chromosome segregation ATPase
MAKQEDLFGGDPTAILEKLNRTLDELVKYKNVLIATIDTANNRMEKIEGRIDKVKPEGIPKELTVEIEKTQEAVEKIGKEVKGIAKITEKLEKSEKNMEEISRTTKELEGKLANDSKFMEAMDTELKSHIADTDEKMKDTNKEIGKISREIEGANRFRKAFGELIKSATE